MIIGLDHIVYAVPNLEKGMDMIERNFGVRPVYGGQHKNQGTHNALLNLHNGSYLELIAIDKQNTIVKPPRWMGVDLITEPTITRWAVRSDNIKEDIDLFKRLQIPVGKILAGSRKKLDGSTLSWEMSAPSSQAKVDPLPFIVDWKDSVHPSQSLPQVCLLVYFAISHPESASMKTLFSELGVKSFPSFIEQSTTISMTISLNSPEGVVSL